MKAGQQHVELELTAPVAQHPGRALGPQAEHLEQRIGAGDRAVGDGVERPPDRRGFRTPGVDEQRAAGGGERGELGA